MCEDVKWKLLSCVWLFATSVDCRLLGSPVHGILQARILEWLAIPFSRWSSGQKDQTQVSRRVGCDKGNLQRVVGTPRISSRGELLDQMGQGRRWLCNNSHMRVVTGGDCLVRAVLFVKGTQPTVQPYSRLILWPVLWWILLAKPTESQKLGNFYRMSIKAASQSSDRRTNVGRRSGETIESIQLPLPSLELVDRGTDGSKSTTRDLRWMEKHLFYDLTTCESCTEWQCLNVCTGPGLCISPDSLSLICSHWRVLLSITVT